MDNHYYKVGGHIFLLSSADVVDEKDIENYAPFRLSEGADNYIFSLSIVDEFSEQCDFELVGQFDDDIASIGVFKSQDNFFRFQIACPDVEDYCTMIVDASFHTAQATFPNNSQLRSFYLNNCLMLLYAFSSARKNTLLIHASVIKNKDTGFVFLGKSGTGKSTHSRLWLTHINDSELLNDDNPVIRIIEDKVWVFGTPWSGKTPCYKNEKAELGGIVKLRQAPENKINKLSSLQAYATILPSCSSMKWEESIMTGIHLTVEKLAMGANCFRLNCLPDKEAAELCSTTIRGNK